MVPSSFARASCIGLLAISAALAGCNPNPFCLNCSPKGDGGPDLVTAGPDLARDGSEPGGPDMVTTCNDGGGPRTEVCNGADDDCNGKVDDDVPQASLQNDPKNCGACDNECLYPHAFGLCAAAKCSMGGCQPGFYDLDKAAANGCEYACIPAPPSLCKQDADCPMGIPCANGQCQKPCTTDADCPKNTICDPNTRLCEGDLCDGQDNNCNGKADEGVDFQNDVSNCGACANACAFPNATGKCQNGACSVSGCVMGFIDLNKNGQDGCEYKCPVFPPKAETCNGTDDDCDGMIDNNPNDVGQACDDFCPPLNGCIGNNSCTFKLSMCAGKCCGVCTQGKTICAGGQRVCQMGAGPKLEVCNGTDDNCDGQIDEGFDLQNDPVNCGSCGTNCSGTLMNAVAGCSKGLCSIITCKPGFKDLDNNTQNGCEYSCPVNPPTVETCNAKDDDCNGVVDDNLVVPNNFCAQTGPCNGSKPSCGGAKGWTCNYQQLNPRIEVDMNGQLRFSETLCDSFDGNCNGQTDESFANLGKACTVGQGACAGKANFVCDGMNPMQTTCPAVADPTKAVDELCNGVDDDCDGVVDEPDNGPGMCRDPMGNARPCQGWHDFMVQVPNGAGGFVYMYQYEASRTDATPQAVGTSSTRACSRSGMQPWAPVTVTAAQNACAAVKDSKGVAMRLCTAPEWQAACNLGVMPPTQAWSYAANQTTYQGSVCNGVDTGRNAAWPTGAGVNCYAKQAQGGGLVYDLSGNVAEWTSTQVVYNGVTYYKVRGGAYNNPSGGTSCNFDFVIQTANYQFNDIGFRCCATNTP